MNISKKIRFEIFKRDGFQCAYCGKTPPEISLEIDHIQPKSKGGKDNIDNLVTACFDCNRGKSNIELDKIPNRVKDNLEIIKEKEEQLKEYRKYILKVRKRIDSDVELIEKQFKIYFKDFCFMENAKLSVRRFLEIIDLHIILDCMDIACLKKDDPQQAWKYFCGICWNKIKDKR